MKTTHKIIFNNSKNMEEVSPNTVNLVVTSPPYPMIEMWDEIFCKQNHDIKNALEKKDGRLAFELMHKELDKIWNEIYRVLDDGGIACINIGDATRTINGNFQLYSNHSRILHHCLKIGFNNLPAIIWRKQTNAPNKFMGSGMLPAGAYVTLEHEFILILRKGNKRAFTTESEKFKRQQSSFFWEERNNWFSDVWMDLKGTTQQLNHKKVRERSGEYPFDLAYRLINMYSAKGDIVLDPYLGTGTTMIAAMASCRNSIGFEIDSSFRQIIMSKMSNIVNFSNAHIQDRLRKHFEFVLNRIETHGELKYINEPYGFPVMTRQEKQIIFNNLEHIEKKDDSSFEISYSEIPQKDFCIKKDSEIPKAIEEIEKEIILRINNRAHQSSKAMVKGRLSTQEKDLFEKNLL